MREKGSGRSGWEGRGRTGWSKETEKTLTRYIICKVFILINKTRSGHCLGSQISEWCSGLQIILSRLFFGVVGNVAHRKKLDMKTNVY